MEMRGNKGKSFGNGVKLVENGTNSVINGREIFGNGNFAWKREKIRENLLKMG